MDLTEPQAGSDLAKVRVQAAPDGDHYKSHAAPRSSLRGVITRWPRMSFILCLPACRMLLKVSGEFLCSSFRSFLSTTTAAWAIETMSMLTSVEHKLGIHASPTCVLNFGDSGGAVGYLVGQENRGLACMFTMMNLARLQVGVQGIAVSERSYQAARDYAKERVQGQVPGGRESARIIEHPDVRRMLMTMKSLIEAMRATAYVTASTIDVANHTEDADLRTASLERSAVLTPVVKGWMTEVAQELTSIGVQVHGGNGYVEETGVAQQLRDAKNTDHL